MDLFSNLSNPAASTGVSTRHYTVHHFFSTKFIVFNTKLSVFGTHSAPHLGFSGDVPEKLIGVAAPVPCSGRPGALR